MGKIIHTYTDFGNRKWRDRLKGGKADNNTPEDFDMDDIKIGTAVQREHTNDPDLATEISMDHLSEDPEYYDKLISSGISDEEDAIYLFNKLKGKNHREKAKNDIIDYMDEYENDYGCCDDEDNDFDDIINIKEYNEKLKNNKKNMSININNYKDFLRIKESNDEQNEIPQNEIPQDVPERRYSKENKYKFQIAYDKKIIDKLNEYNFTLYIPDEERESSAKPSKSTHNIVIDILNLTYSVVEGDKPEIRDIDMPRLKNLLDNL